MSTILGIESTAHTFGVGIVKDGKILSNVKKSYITEKGGIVMMDAVNHHEQHKNNILEESLSAAKISMNEIDAIAFSQAPGLSQCLLVGIKFAKELSRKFNKPLIPVNHCIAHLEIGKITGAKDPVMLYTSGANTQIIAYASGKYRIFGETLDIGVGNFIDNFARYLGMGFPGGPKVEELAKKSKNYIELPYKVKGMDIALSGILTNLKQKIGKMNKNLLVHSHLQINKKMLTEESKLSLNNRQGLLLTSQKKFVSGSEHKIEQAAGEQVNYTSADLAYSMQETVFAMLVEIAERAMAHIGKKELLLGGGVGCNKRLQEMCGIMCKERNAKFFVPEKSLLVDNGAMIAYAGEIMFKSGIKFSGREMEKLDINPRQRTDEVDVSWR